MKRLMMTGAGLALAILSASCSSSPPPAPLPPPETPVAPPPVAIAPQQPKDQCGMEEAKAFVGKKRTDLPAPVDPTRWRVACTTCPVTMDFRPDRLNILFDADTAIVKEVKCG
jgi:hypothetical protein